MRDSDNRNRLLSHRDKKIDPARRMR